MDGFTIEIAGLAARVQPLFVSTRDYCRGYLTEREPELHIAVTEEDLDCEQARFEQEAVEEGLRIRKFTGPFLERATIQRRVAEALVERNTVLLHGSTVALDGDAYLFTAPCGTGKSTHTRLWREAFGSRAVMVNDDKTFLHLTPAGVLAYGSPWSGKHGLDSNVCFPLRGICFLSRGTENRIRQAEPEAWVGELLHQTLIPEKPPGREKARALVDALARAVPLWEMACTKDPSAAQISHRAMAPETDIPERIGGSA